MNDDLTDRAQEELHEVLLQYVEAAEAGGSPDRDALMAAHPQYAKEIAEFLASYRKVNNLVTPLRDDEARRAAIEALSSVLRGNGRADAAVTEAPPGALHGIGEPVTSSELGQLGDYRLLREIGRGGMGVVYEAEQISLRRRVALKILPFAGGADSRQLQRFRNEAEAAAHLHHSHIVPVFAVGAERGVHFYAMQFIEGQSLASLIADLAAQTPPRPSQPEPSHAKTHPAANVSTQTVGALSTERSARPNRFYQRVAAIGKDTAEALDYAHQMGVVHRDIKPANLLLDGRGEVWITDFGLAQFASQTGLTFSGEVLGTIRYASPEQAMAKRGLVDHRTDIYSLGATLYELLTLQPVFDGKDRHALLHQIAFEEPRPPRAIDPSIPIELETIVLKALAKNPPDRYASAQELADDLQRFLDDKPIQARRPSLIDRGRKWMRRHPAFVAASVLLLLFGLIASLVSTILIAREQHKTQQAYEQLEKEERRAKAAYVELAEEQARTKGALEAEATQRRIAEWDFAQAQRAIELVVQFSEGELAHKPDQQEVRRRLLLTVLDYYEDFLALHADDLGLQAGRERVAQLVTELSTLRGNALLIILRDPDVQEELALSDEQRKWVGRYLDTRGKPYPPKEKGPPSIELAAGIEKALEEILSASQKQRFQQIVLQVQNQGRYGFSDPTLVETLRLSIGQREKIRLIQNETHQAWADHVFSDRKIKNPAQFWKQTQDRIYQVLEPGQLTQWQAMAGRPVEVDFREGYPFDGRDMKLPPRKGPPFDFHERGPGPFAFLAWGDDPVSSGFGRRSYGEERQGYFWRGKEIPPTVFEIAVTPDPLSGDEARFLLTKKDRPPGKTMSPRGWTILFRSSDPSVWNKDHPDPARFALPLARAPKDTAYLRLRRMDTGDYQILSIRHEELAVTPRGTFTQDYAWNGLGEGAMGLYQLGIAEQRPHRGKFRPPFKKDFPRK